MKFANGFLVYCLILLISTMATAADKPAKHPKTGEPLVIDVLRGTPN